MSSIVGYTLSTHYKYRDTAIVSGMIMLASLVLVVGFSPSVFGDEMISITNKASNQGCEKTESCYSQTGLIIKVGETVTWRNNDHTIHTISSGSYPLGDYGYFKSEKLLPTNEFSHTFEESGQFFYYCVTHPWMNGIVMARQISEA